MRNNFFDWEIIRRKYPQEVDILSYIEDITLYTKECRMEPREAIQMIKGLLDKNTLPPQRKDIDKPFIKIEFPNHCNYETDTDVNIPITKGDKVIGFVKDIYETRCIGYIFTQCIDIIPEVLVDEKRVMSFEFMEDKD